MVSTETIAKTVLANYEDRSRIFSYLGEKVDGWCTKRE